jgi:SAM-dependent methyltransferase
MERWQQHVVCRICGNSSQNAVYSVPEMMFGYRDRFDYFQCSSCKCLQIAEVPPDMSKYYPPHYYSFTPKQRRFQNNPVDRALRRLQDHYTVFNRGIFGSLVSTVSPNKKLAPLSRIGLTRDSRILDVGCGNGRRLYALREIGFLNVLGVDPYLREDINYGNGLRVLKQSVYDVTGEWDLIMYHHSFEHVPDPVENLLAASKLLRAGGCCLVRVPTVSSYAWEQYRENWVQLDAPRHYMLPSLEGMNVLAAKTGFHVREVVFDSTKDQFQGSELYQRGIPLVSGEKVFSASQIREWKRQAKKLNKGNRGDQAAFYLIKK